MATLSVSIMAHSRRAELVGDLVERLGVTPDRVIWDRRDDRWDTGRRAMMSYDSDAEWHIVIQDDAIVCADLIAGLEIALDSVPEKSIVCPFIGTRRPAVDRVRAAVREARERYASWVRMETLNWGLAIAVPTRTIDDMVKWADAETYPNYDRRVGRYYWRVLRWSTWYTWPSLVDHRKVPSLAGHGDGRVAHEFIGESTSALDCRWDGPCISMDRVRTQPPRKRLRIK